ncbi:MAG TPA: membrane dipeptidase [Gaiellaceae bacterium]|nr:membrane dipeptidase [Gaiellaceae bacterium]
MSAASATSERAAELHRRALIVNGLCGSMAVPKTPDAPFDLPASMRAGGVTAVNLTISVSDGFRVTCKNLSHLLKAIDRQAGDGVRVARTVEDLTAAKAEDGAAIIIGFQNSDPIEGSLENLDLFHRLGLRIVQLTYQRRNLVADGGGEPANGGLSLFGRELVAELNRLGILIDLSHTGVASSLEAIELSEAPVSITHSCLQHFNPVSRNATDEEVKALAAKGGVFGMNGIARLISPTGRQEGATVAQLVDQIDYLVDLVGIDHIGIGLDINEGLTPELFEQRRKGFLTEFPELKMGGDFPFEHYYAFGLTSMASVHLITEELVARDYADEDVLKVLGGNFVRLLGEVWSR